MMNNIFHFWTTTAFVDKNLTSIKLVVYQILAYKLEDASKGTPVVNKLSNNTYEFNFPCLSNWNCTDYIIDLKSGMYSFQLYGASGGAERDRISTYRYPDLKCKDQSIVSKYNGNTNCLTFGSVGGAAGLVSGIIQFKSQVRLYATIGGKGIYKVQNIDNSECYIPENMIRGGYGGGGRASCNSGASGGGATSVKLLKNDLWHRIIVSAGGGGTDNYVYDLPARTDDDGSGGSAGDIEAQGFWISGKYVGNYSANSTFGFSFGQGEAVQKLKSLNSKGVQESHGGTDRGGAGGGWFGGFASHHHNGGAGAGSSWILSKNAIFYEGEIEAHDEFYNPIGKKPYAFDANSQYIFTNISFVSGIWKGHGKMIIRYLGPCEDSLTEKNIRSMILMQPFMANAMNES